MLTSRENANHSPFANSYELPFTSRKYKTKYIYDHKFPFVVFVENKNLNMLRRQVLEE
jgi:hypothetical protein